MQKVIRILQLRIFGDEGDGSTSSQEVSHASPFPLPAGERARRTAVTSGLTCSVPFTRSGPVGLLVRTLVASSRWYSPARRLTWDVSPLCSERISLYTASGRNTSSRPSAVILSVKDIPSSRCLFRLIPACAVGAPHRRDRVWFVAHADGEGLQPEGTELSPEGSSGNHPRDVAAHPDSDGDTPPAAGGTLETSGGRVDARDGGRGEEPQRPDGLPGLPRAAPDTDCKGLEGRADLGKFPKEGEEPASGQPSRFLCPVWEEFPTQSPVCGRDDGVPRQLDGITFSSWRQQSVKGYGNAIVPQVIHEIFKAIESTYK